MKEQCKEVFDATIAKLILSGQVFEIRSTLLRLSVIYAMGMIILLFVTSP